MVLKVAFRRASGATCLCLRIARHPFARDARCGVLVNASSFSTRRFLDAGGACRDVSWASGDSLSIDKWETGCECALRVPPPWGLVVQAMTPTFVLTGAVAVKVLGVLERASPAPPTPFRLLNFARLARIIFTEHALQPLGGWAALE